MPKKLREKFWIPIWSPTEVLSNCEKWPSMAPSICYVNSALPATTNLKIWTDGFEAPTVSPIDCSWPMSATHPRKLGARIELSIYERVVILTSTLALIAFE